MTYRNSGVDIDKANKLVSKFKSFVKSTRTEGAISTIGNFSGLFKPNLYAYKDPVLVGSTDGVGTKLKIAFMMNKHNTVGIDLVAMSVNDVLALGAKPLFFLDYIATGKIRPAVLVKVMEGIAIGCRQSGCALIGGETAEMPSFYKDNEYDLAGFCVGIVDRKKIINGSRMEIGDILVGLPSSGLHSNGFSFVRKVFSESEIKKGLWKTLLTPTRIYAPPILELIKTVEIKGIAHITGGAFYDKLPRILRGKKSLTIRKKSWEIPPIFKTIQKRSGASDKEMYRTFNMGIGMVIAISPKDISQAQEIIERSEKRFQIIGEVIKGNKEVIFK
ncbi:MAG: phosphoribosylformylglycinamidine cyclo-ligase [Candidatus Omnitrophota bacterium]